MPLYSEQEVLNRVFDSTNNRLNVTAAAEAMALSTLNDVTTTNETTGDLLYRTSGDWKNLGAAAVSSILKSGGLSSAPFWAATSALAVTAPALSAITLSLSAIDDTDMTNLTTGDVIYRNSAAQWTNLIGNTAGSVLITAGLSAAPYWGASSAVGVDTGITNISAASDVAFGSITRGDIIYQTSTSDWTNLTGGTAGQVLVTAGLSAAPYWGNTSALFTDTGITNISAAADVTFTNPTGGDLIYKSSAGDWMNVAGTTTGLYLQTNGLSAAPSWTAITAPALSAVTLRLSAIDDTDMTNLTTGDVVYRNSAAQWTNLIGGTAGQFLTTQGLSAAPTWTTAAAGAATPEFESFSALRNSAETSQTLVGGGAATFNATALTIDSSATISSSAKVRKYETNSQYAAFGSNSYFSVIGALNTAPTTGNFMVGVGQVTVGGTSITTTVNHYGFKVRYAASASTASATNADGTTETATTIAGLTLTNAIMYHAKKTATTNVKYYTDRTLQATHTTNLPTGNNDFVGIGITNEGTATQYAWELASYKYNQDAE